MQLQYAAETLQPLPESHIYVQKTLQATEMKALAQEDPVKLLEIVVASFDGKVTQDQLQKALAPEIVPEGDFKRWWDTAKKVIRKSGQFTVPAKKTGSIVARDQTVSFQSELIQSFQNARQLKGQNAQLEQIMKNLDAFTPEQLQTVVAQVEEIAGRNIRLNPAAAAELLLARDEIIRKRPELAGGELSVVQVLREQTGKLAELVNQVSVARQRPLLNEVPRAFPEDWSERVLRIMPEVGYRVVSEIARLFEESGQTDAFRHYLLRTLREHSISSEVLYWLCRERPSFSFAELIEPELLAAILSAIERDQFNAARRGSRLHDLLLDDRDLMADLLMNAPVSQARDLMRRMMMTPAFEELNKRSLLARMIRVHPELQSMLTGETEEQEQPLVVSWPCVIARTEIVAPDSSAKISCAATSSVICMG